MSESFTCSVCGEEHAGLIKDWAFKLPDVVWTIPEPERAEQARFTTDLCKFGERYFIRTVLQLPLADAEGYFGWGVWSEVEWTVFERYLEMYDEDGSSEPPHWGKLANAVPIYDSSLDAPVLIQFRDPTQRPFVRLADENVSSLATDQRNGISDERHHEIVAELQAM